MKEIDAYQLKAMRDAGEDFELIDVREPHEYEIANLGGRLIPKAEIGAYADELPRDKKVIIHCRTGGRSGIVVQQLEAEHGFDNLYNLRGGILAYADHIDPSLTKY